MTASFGLAMVKDHPDFTKWFAAADSALYKAKRGGRNCWMTDRIESDATPVESRPQSFLSALKLGFQNQRTAGKTADAALTEAAAANRVIRSSAIDVSKLDGTSLRVRLICTREFFETGLLIW